MERHTAGGMIGTLQGSRVSRRNFSKCWNNRTGSGVKKTNKEGSKMKLEEFNERGINADLKKTAERSDAG